MVRRVTQSGALPVSRDAPGYAAVLGVLGVVDCCEGAGKEEPGVGVSGGKEKPAMAGESRHNAIVAATRYVFISRRALAQYNAIDIRGVLRAGLTA